MEAKIFKPNKNKRLEIDVEGVLYQRLPIKTDVITEKDNLLALLQKHVALYLEADDMIFISEKVVALTQGRIIKIKDIKPTKFARFLASHVDNRLHTKDFRGFGHGTSMAMQLLIEEAGYPRILLAATVAAVTRPLGIKGLFYIICGKKAKSIDCPMSFDIWPYLHYAKLSPLHPEKVAAEVKKKFRHDVVIIDANYRGAFTLAITSKTITEKFACAAFRDNPLGQSDELTPFCIVRKACV